MKQNVPCIDDFELAGYLDNSLPDREWAEVAHFLEESSEYRLRTAIIRQVLGNTGGQPMPEAPPEYLIERAVHLHRPRRDALDIVLSLAGNALRVIRTSPGVSLLPAPLVPVLRRSGASGPSLSRISKTFDTITVNLAVEYVADSRCSFILTVSDRVIGMPPRRLRAELLSSGREYASCQLDHGQALFEDIRPGQYDIRLKQGCFVLGNFLIRIDR